MPIAVVTGTSTGIGLTTSVHLAQQGYQVFAGMRNTSKADALKAAAEGLPVQVVQMDICDPASVAAAFATRPPWTGCASRQIPYNPAAPDVRWCSIQFRCWYR